MASARKSAAPARPLPASTAAFDQGEGAWGARYKKPGFARAPEQDLWFALGYPHVTFLVDGHADDALPNGDERLLKVATGNYGNEGAPHVPRGIALAQVRTLPVLKFDVNGSPNFDDFRAAAERTDPLTVAEAQELLTQCMGKRFFPGLQAQLLIHLLEAFLGTDPVLACVTALLEQCDAAFWTGRVQGQAAFVHWTGYALLRASVAQTARSRDVFERLLASFPEHGVHSCAHYLDVAVRGAAAIRAGQEPPTGQNYVHVLDAPELVATKIEQEPADPTYRLDPRLAFLGGERVLQHYRKNWKKVKEVGYLREALVPFGHIASDAALELLLTLAASSKVKKEAAAWFVANAESARAFLTQAATRKDDLAEVAAALLAKL